MDYPFVKQTGKDYASHVTSIVERQQSRRQITANTIRILLLEEQNSELRSKSASEERSDSETTASLNFKVCDLDYMIHYQLTHNYVQARKKEEERTSFSISRMQWVL